MYKIGTRYSEEVHVKRKKQLKFSDLILKLVNEYVFSTDGIVVSM